MCLVGPKPAAPIPERFVAYLFDDLHLSQGDLMQVRAAAARHLDESLKTTDRAAIYTMSGQTMLEFTGDKEALLEAMRRIQPRSIQAPAGSECPDVSYYLGDMIVNKNDQRALQGERAVHQRMARRTDIEAKLRAEIADIAETIAVTAAKTGRRNRLGDEELRAEQPSRSAKPRGGHGSARGREAPVSAYNDRTIRIAPPGPFNTRSPLTRSQAGPPFKARRKLRSISCDGLSQAFLVMARPPTSKCWFCCG